MTIKEMRRKLARNDPSIGSWLQLPSADAAEIMARSGYDWLAVDMEHGSFGISLLPDMFRAIQLGRAVPFARLPEASKVWIKAALEAGAQGLIFPMIESAEQLGRAIDLATYPGQTGWQGFHDATGARRGVGFCRANGFGKYFDNYMREMASDIFIVAQIEHIRAVENLGEILENGRLDAIMVGPYDLSGSMGLTGQFEHPDFMATMNRIASLCKEKGIIMGSHVVEPDPLALGQEIKRGGQFIAYGIDTLFLWKAAQCPHIQKSAEILSTKGEDNW